MRPSLKPGLTAAMAYKVPIERTVPSLLPEATHFARMPEVLATGYLVGLVEWTCMQALEDHLDEGERTLGTHIDLSHEAPTPPGATLTIEVELLEVDRRRLTFAVVARDDVAVVCRGRHQRGVVELDRFEAKLAYRRSAKPDS